MSEAKRGGVVVGMSGGVDSSVAAALLIEQGYRVTGVMIQVWKDPTSRGAMGGEDCAFEDAQHVADHLGIPLRVINAESAFLEEVIQPFITGYLEGVTPSPCALCNRRVKSRFLLRAADEIGAEYAATGHYARLQTSPEGRELQLLKGVDLSKDQSYMLALVSREDLKRLILPIGGLLKSDIRRMAARMGLPAADRKDSQDLCFLPDGDYRSFLKRHAAWEILPGDIVNLTGEVLGRHEGLPFYTIGQRKGIRLAAARPLYVLRKEAAANRLVVGEREELGSRELKVGAVNWIAAGKRVQPFRAEVKVRYRATPHWGLVSPAADGSAAIMFEEDLLDITPGQVAVFYEGESVVGGGVILSG